MSDQHSACGGGYSLPNFNIPITEASNSFSEDIDIVNSNDLSALLYSCDRDIFHGWQNCKAHRLTSDKILNKIQRVAEEVAEVLKEEQPGVGSVVFSGCGTSGRIAFLTARAINELLVSINCQQSCEYIIAGGDAAILASRESEEDNPQAGMLALKQLCRNKKKVVFVGISCGLSAPFIAGQLDYCMNHLDVYVPVLIGFNPVELAWNTAIEHWEETFRTVASKLSVVEGLGKGYIINPILGPEAITGSSRMKGGTATIILLETVMLNAIRQLPSRTYYSSPTTPTTSLMDSPAHSPAHDPAHDPAHSPTPDPAHGPTHSPDPTVGTDLLAERAVCCGHVMNMYEAVWRDTNTQAVRNGLGEAIDWAGTSLNANGHVYYVGVDHLGLMGLIDASECPPTFGADENDIRGFVDGGYSFLGNKRGDLYIEGTCFSIDLDYFKHNVITSLTSSDTVIFLTSTSRLSPPMVLIVELVRRKECRVVALACYLDGTERDENVLEQIFPKLIEVRIPVTHHIRGFLSDKPECSWFFSLGLHLMRRFAAEMSCKLLLNTISTGAHIKKGKVCRNLMVDLKLSNSKLFHRGLEIVKALTQCSDDAALVAVIRSVYQIDTVPQKLLQCPVSMHTKVAPLKRKVIPLAIILISSSSNCTVEEAMEILGRFPIVRVALGMLCPVKASRTVAGNIA